MAHVHGAAAKTAANHAHHAKSAADHAHHAHHATNAADHAHHAVNAAGSSHKMMEQAGHMLANMPKHTGMAAAGTAAVAAATPRGQGFMGFLARHPLVIFGLGVAVGYLAHKYRKEIIQSAGGLTGDFGQQQHETLDDLVAECQECAAEEPTKAPGKPGKG